MQLNRIVWAVGLRSGVLCGAAFLVMLLPAIVMAFADGKGYRIESLPDERWQSKYPPVFPLLLAAVWRISPHFPVNVTSFLIVAWLALPVLLVLELRMLVALEFRGAHLAIACLATLAYPGTLLLSVTLLSDLWFCAEILMVMWLAERASEPEADWKAAAVSGLAAALAYLTKFSAIVLFVSVIAMLLYNRRWRNALVFAAVLGPVVATSRSSPIRLVLRNC
jgi:4-amino-4-deoxy-L-arabinose transferase-like glycosyltransferase